VTANDNGKLEFSEFCEIIAKNRKSLEEEQEELTKAFQLFDKNGDGTIDREELKKVINAFEHTSTAAANSCMFSVPTSIHS